MTKDFDREKQIAPEMLFKAHLWPDKCNQIVKKLEREKVWLSLYLVPPNVIIENLILCAFFFGDLESCRHEKQAFRGASFKKRAI